ncbi:hypothetical protein [Pseudomonas mangiferae]|uniref:Uncharacterized protein n=1 Tax=Pseudomonas mangiferae TaxID=2593654 RepID=A0A553GUS0_9PSED|nr:hypothetical protein [Pseudomonas mangiferae]TRX73247.1 hypothetical protein FM069_18920 [Pseudomonas mangiferae]
MVKFLYAVVVCFFIVFALIAFCLAVYVSIFKLDEIEKYLENSAAIKRSPLAARKGWWERLYRTDQIAGLLMFERYSLRKGILALEDLDRLPINLHRWVTWSYGVLAMNVIIFMALVQYGRYRGWIGVA